jgi:sugar/nucleoside kinase (ribokinase family)
VREPAFPVVVADGTGAGDSFDAGFLAAFLGGESLQRCLQVGNACGALSTLGVGGTATQPTMVEALDTIERGTIR